MRHLDWRGAFSFMTDESGWARTLFIGGLAILVFPPLGWPLALGYRKEVAFRLVDGRRPYLPEWHHWRKYLTDGLAATGVIVVYYLPFLAIFWTLALDDWATASAHLPQIALFFVAVPVLTPVCLPLLPPLYAWLFPWIHLGTVEMFAVGAVFWVTTFLMPAAFLQVSLYGKFRAAFRFKRVLSLVLRCLSPYLEAWTLSLIATALALASGLFAPWGIFWSYLVIVHAFNSALRRWQVPEVGRRFAHSALGG